MSIHRAIWSQGNDVLPFLCKRELGPEITITSFSRWWFQILDSLRGSSDKIGTIQRRLAWPLRKDDTHKSTLDFFVDGSCQLPREPKLRFASWAITVATGLESMLEHHVVAFGHVIGHHQTSYRGELTAMVKTAQLVRKLGRRARIWSDCLSVVRRARLVLQGVQVKMNSPHADLWSLFAEAVDGLEPNQLVVCKVVSHCDLAAAGSDVEIWAFWHNQIVDRVAGQWNYKRPQQFWDVWSSAVSQLAFARKLHTEILKVFLSVGRKGHQYKAEYDEPEGTPDVDGRSDGFLPVARAENGGDLPLHSEWTSSIHLTKRCLPGNIDAVLQWWTHQGISAIKSGRGETCWVSGLQIFLDFFLTTGNQGVVIHQGVWYDDISTIPMSPSIHLSQRSRSFQYLWGKLLGENDFQVQKKLQRPRSAAVAMWCQCYRIPWCHQRLAVIDRYLLSLHRRQLCHSADLQVELKIPKGNEFAFA